MTMKKLNLVAWVPAKGIFVCVCGRLETAMRR